MRQSASGIGTAAKTPMTIISTPIVLEPDYRALSNAVGILDKIKDSGAFRAGTPGADTIPELLAFGDRIMYVTGKVGFNAFSNTTLDAVLKEREIKDVLVAGMITSLCIDSTGRAAYERGYSVTVLSDLARRPAPRPSRTSSAATSSRCMAPWRAAPTSLPSSSRLRPSKQHR